MAADLVQQLTDSLGSTYLSPDLLLAARELERGRLAEKRGDRQRADDAYSYVAEARWNADPKSLRDRAMEARDALARLEADGRMRAPFAGSPR